MKNDLNIKALTFDTGGTILDWHSGFKEGFKKIRDKNNLNFSTPEYANLMRKKSLEKVTNQNNNNLINFDKAHQIAVEEIIIEKKLNVTEEEKYFLYYITPTKLKVWPDFLNPFQLLKKKYFCVSFTLLSNRLVYTNSKANNISWDLVLSCETLEAYKPNIEAYKKTANLLQFKPEECLMIACHSFDLNAAQKAGYKTAFVKRDKEWGKNTLINVDGKYDFVVNNFSELQKILDN
tara:strand:- start:870 stop:1574 length:705 start_codon:yes stop_codon:yes gene_type:complete